MLLKFVETEVQFRRQFHNTRFGHFVQRTTDVREVSNKIMVVVAQSQDDASPVPFSGLGHLLIVSNFVDSRLIPSFEMMRLR